MALKRKSIQSNKNQKKLRGDADATTAAAAASTYSSPHYWKHFLHYQRQFSQPLLLILPTLKWLIKLHVNLLCLLLMTTEYYSALKSREIKLVYRNHANIFLGFYLKAVNADAELETAAINMALISLVDHERLCYSPSTVAAAIVILASHHSFSCQHLLTITDDVQHCARSLEKWLEDYYN